MTMSTSYKPVPFGGLPAYPDEVMRARARAFRALMATRRTIRQFSERPVPREVIAEALATAATAPSGANKQPWHFAVVSDPAMKTRIREAAEAEERGFYAGKAGAPWLADLAPLGTDPEKPFLEAAPYLIVVFQQNYGIDPESGRRTKHYYIQESVGLVRSLPENCSWAASTWKARVLGAEARAMLAHRQAFATRQSRFPDRPEGPCYRGLGTSSAAACDAPASLRGAVLVYRL